MPLLGDSLRTSNGRSAADSPRAAPLWLILAALLLGAVLRAPLAGPERALEGALVVAGVVDYPPASLMAHYYLGSWTLLHQAGALLLLAGLDQRALELLFCVAPSGLMLGAFAMWIYGFCRRPVFSLVAATLCFLTGILADRFASPDYPLMGVTWDRAASHSYGLWSGALAAWFFGALAGGRNRMAGVTAALLVAVHPVIGVHVAGVALALLVTRRWLLPDLPIAGLGRGLVFGGVASAVSLGVYLAMRPPVEGGVDARAFETYLALWEFHRNVAMPAVRVVLGPVALFGGALLAVLLFPRGPRSATDVGALALLVTIAASCALYFAVHLASDLLPEVFERAMPARLLNLHASLAGAAGVGIVAWALERGFGGALRRRPLVYAALALLLFLGTGAAKPLGDFATRAAEFARHRLPYLYDVDPFWAAVRGAGVDGLVLTSFDAAHPAVVEGHLALAFDPTGFDFVPYLPHTARDVQRFVERGYGVSFSKPPPELRLRGALEADPQRAYWERLAPEEWSALGAELGVAAVVAPSEWAIRLAPAAPGPHLTFYRIPGAR